MTLVAPPMEIAARTRIFRMVVSLDQDGSRPGEGRLQGAGAPGSLAIVNNDCDEHVA
jgi:hypothetical protein